MHRIIIALEFPMPPYYAAAANDHEPHSKHQAWPLKLLDDLVPGAHRARERRRGGIISLAERGRGRGNGMRATASLEKGFGGTFCFHVYRRQQQPGEDEDESKVRIAAGRLVECLVARAPRPANTSAREVRTAGLSRIRTGKKSPAETEVQLYTCTNRCWPATSTLPMQHSWHIKDVRSVTRCNVKERLHRATNNSTTGVHTH